MAVLFLPWNVEAQKKSVRFYEQTKHQSNIKQHLNQQFKVNAKNARI